MKIESKNLHSPLHAELEVTVGYGEEQNGTEFPAITYHISPRGLSIDRLTCDGVHRGGVDLPLTMLDVLCKVSGTARDDVIATRAKLFPAYEARLHDQHHLAGDVDALRDAAVFALNHQSNTVMHQMAPALLRVLEAFAATQPQVEQVESCSSSCGARCGGNAKPTEAVVRKMKTPEGSRAFTGEQLADRMMQICGCKGRHDCDCVSVQTQARVELWTEHNTRARQA